MKKIILTVFFTLVVIAIGGVIFIYSGKYDVSQMSHHNKITQWIIGKTMEHSITKRIKEVPAIPPLDDTTMIAEGFRHYNEMCVVCHGGAGIEQSEMVKGLYPEPPKLYKSEMPDPGSSFWIIKNGIRMTSMPAFGPTHTDEQIWAITAFMIKKLNSLSPEEYQAWIKKYPDNE
jgi:mono/diheme cytochrome c family protein